MARGAGVSGRGRGRGGAAIVPFVGPQPEFEEAGAVDGAGVDTAGVAGARAGLAGVGAGEHVDNAEGPGTLGAAAGVAHGPVGGLTDLLRQLLERLPGVVPVQAPVAPQVPVVPQVVAEVQPRAAVAGVSLLTQTM